jgi:hypothetical protein
VSVDRAGAWVLIAVCCAGALPWALRAELRAAFPHRDRARFREAPARFAGACASGLLTGAAIGMAVAFAALTLAAIAERAAA